MYQLIVSCHLHSGKKSVCLFTHKLLKVTLFIRANVLLVKSNTFYKGECVNTLKVTLFLRANVLPFKSNTFLKGECVTF